jgi:hypothetical protein
MTCGRKHDNGSETFCRWLPFTVKAGASDHAITVRGRMPESIYQDLMNADIRLRYFGKSNNYGIIAVAQGQVLVASNEISLANDEYSTLLDGDGLLYSRGPGNSIGGLNDGTVYYARKSTAPKIKLFDTKANAINTGAMTGLKTLTSTGNPLQTLQPVSSMNKAIGDYTSGKPISSHSIASGSVTLSNIRLERRDAKTTCMGGTGLSSGNGTWENSAAGCQFCGAGSETNTTSEGATSCRACRNGKFDADELSYTPCRMCGSGSSFVADGTTLAAGATSVTVASNAHLGATIGSHIFINREIIKVTSVSGDTLGLQRAVMNTLDNTHVGGSTV